MAAVMTEGQVATGLTCPLTAASKGLNPSGIETPPQKLNFVSDRLQARANL
jgi:hypothetical protein